MAIDKSEKLQLRLQILYDIRNIFNGTEFASVRRALDVTIRELEAQKLESDGLKDSADVHRRQTPEF